MGDLDYFSAHYPGDLGGYTDAMFETDSAFSESASLPSSESFTSMVTVSSSIDPSMAGDSCSTSSGSTLTPQSIHSDVSSHITARLCVLNLNIDGKVWVKPQPSNRLINPRMIQGFIAF